jgi:hypothetical protein
MSPSESSVLLVLDLVSRRLREQPRTAELVRSDPIMLQAIKVTENALFAVVDHMADEGSSLPAIAAVVRGALERLIDDAATDQERRLSELAKETP